VNVNTGDQRLLRNPNRANYSAIATSGNSLVVAADENGFVSAFDPRSEQLLWNVRVVTAQYLSIQGVAINEVGDVLISASRGGFINPDGAAAQLTILRAEK